MTAIDPWEYTGDEPLSVTGAIGLPSRMQRRNRWWRRALSWWRETIALIVIFSVVATAIIVINHRDASQEAKLIHWTDVVQVSGQVGQIPTVALQHPVSVTSPKAITLAVGAGREIKAETPLIISVTSFSGETGKLLSPTGRSVIHIGSATSEFFDKDLLQGVIGENEGARILFIRPVSVEGKLTTEINVVDVLYSAAHGAAAETTAGPLNVSFSDAGPLVTHKSATAPDEVTIQPLIVGEGQQVLENDLVLAQFVTVGWDDFVVRSSTWHTGIPQSIDLQAAFPGLQVALLDQKVGSRIAVAIPAEMATGEMPLMMVIDILATSPALPSSAVLQDEKPTADTPVEKPKANNK